jgi:hypothetical protein
MPLWGPLLPPFTHEKFLAMPLNEVVSLIIDGSNLVQCFSVQFQSRGLGEPLSGGDIDDPVHAFLALRGGDSPSTPLNPPMHLIKSFLAIPIIKFSFIFYFISFFFYVK